MNRLAGRFIASTGQHSNTYSLGSVHHNTDALPLRYCGDYKQYYNRHMKKTSYSSKSMKTIIINNIKNPKNNPSVLTSVYPAPGPHLLPPAIPF